MYMQHFLNQYNLPTEINLFVIAIELPWQKMKSNSGLFECQFHELLYNICIDWLPHLRRKMLKYFEKCWKFKYLYTYKSRCIIYGKLKKNKKNQGQRRKFMFERKILIFYWRTLKNVALYGVCVGFGPWLGVEWRRGCGARRVPVT